MNNDNLDAAMLHETQHITPTIPPKTTPGEPASRQVLLRATPHDHDRWKQAAETLGISMAEYIRNCCNDKARDLLDCDHPLQFRRWYPWSEQCLRCGLRLRA